MSLEFINSIHKFDQNLHINQVLSTIQGEGEMCGIPSVLLRFAGCNCCCPWCDTKYSWNVTDGNSIINESNYISLLNRINQYRTHLSIDNLMITGGEPFLYINNPLFWKLIEECEYPIIEFETNGSLLDYDKIPDINKLMFINISPKLERNYYYYQEHFDNLAVNVSKFIEQCRIGSKVSGVSFKFVDSGLNADRQKIQDFINRAGISMEYNAIQMIALTPDKHLYKDELEFLRRFKSANLETVAYCMRKGYMFSPRLHMWLFDDKEEKLPI